MTYGPAIRIVRTARGLTKAQLAKRLSIGASYLSLIEAEKRQPSLKVLEEISGALQVPPHLLALLASDPGDLDDPGNAERIGELARSLVRLLVSGRDQPLLPLERPISKERTV
jgi:transcriptional regulator with XRE-family HTH domain